MKSKKILAGVCASLMLAATTIPAVSAADSVSVKVGSAKAEAGKEFSVNVELSNIPAGGVNACDFGIKYDSSIIKVTGVEPGALVKDDDSALASVNALETNLEDGLVSIIYGLGTTDSAKYMTGSGVFLTIKGTVNGTAEVGDKSKLEIVAVDRLAAPTGSASNADIIFGVMGADITDTTMYTTSVTNGEVEVAGGQTTPTETTPTEKPTSSVIDPGKVTMLGDVDKNGEVAIADVVLSSKYCSAPAKNPLDAVSLANGDVNRDGDFNSMDLSMIIEYVLGTIKSF